MDKERLVVLAIVVGGILVFIWLGRVFLRWIRGWTSSMSPDEMRGLMLSRRVNNPDAELIPAEQLQQVAYNARRGGGKLKWMAITMVVLAFLDALMNQGKILAIILDAIAKLLSR